MHNESRTQTKHMKSTRTNYRTGKSTYALLVRAQDEENSVYETAIYMLFILSAVFSIWQVAHQPMRLPTAAITVSTTQVAQSNVAVQQQGA